MDSLVFITVVVFAALLLVIFIAARVFASSRRTRTFTVDTTQTVDRIETDIDDNAGQILLEDLVAEGLADGLDTSSLAALEHFEFNSLKTDGRRTYTIRNSQTGDSRTYASLEDMPATLRVLFEGP